MDDVNPEFWIRNQEECLKKLETLWDKIPHLGIVPDHLLKEGQLVRFRGMVQDMSNPVFFMEKCEVENTATGLKETLNGKFKETILFKDNESFFDNYEMGESLTKERRPYYCITVPGLNAWAFPNVDLVNQSQQSSVPTLMKRTAEEMEVESTEPSVSDVNKRQCSNVPRKTNESKEAAKVLDLHFPIPGPKNRACFVILYDAEDGCVKVNDVIEAVGFLWYPTNDMAECEEGECHLPSSLVPRLHAVSFKKIISSNPLYSAVNNGDILSNAQYFRAELHLALTQLLLGDSLAANYLICNLISKIYLRQDILSLGKFAVNISNIPRNQTYTELIYKVISQLVAKSHYLPISLSAMNSLELLPVKDYDSNRLKSGMLQLSDNTHLVLDETKLEVGKLEEKGVKNIGTLNDLILMQRLSYDFKYYRMEFLTDIPVLTLSDGKSLLESDVHVILEPVESCTVSLEENYEAVLQYLKEPLLSQLRLFITTASLGEFQLPEDLLETIQEDFVKMRQNPKLKMSGDDLHSLLVLARLMCLSHGHGTLSKEMWDRCREMELARKMRILKNAEAKTSS